MCPKKNLQKMSAKFVMFSSSFQYTLQVQFCLSCSLPGNYPFL